MLDATGIGTLLGGTAAWGASLRIIISSVQRELRTELRTCHERNETLKDRLSALETELVVLRKLLPGGEWERKLLCAYAVCPLGLNERK